MKNTSSKGLQVLEVFAIVIIFFTVLTGCDKNDDPKPAPPQPPVVSVTALANPSVIEYGDSAKISITATNAASFIVSANGKIIKGGSVPFELKINELVETTTYTVTATNGSQSKSVDVTVTVKPMHPKLKLFLDGKWMLVKEEKMKKWNGETEYTAFAPVPCEADNVYSFTLRTCTVDWSILKCSPEIEDRTNKIYFGGLDPVNMKILWQQADSWDVLELSETTLRIHTLISRLDDFTILTDYIKEYKNVAK